MNDWTVRTMPVWTGRNEFVGQVLQNGVIIHRTLPQCHEIVARREAAQWLLDWTWGRKAA